ncbi:hypothetical protein SAMN05216436_103128 [bacterium A37T11]|nr:hypothetical protein SAMN05216436_103128 [bacterium A37T11]
MEKSNNIIPKVSPFLLLLIPFFMAILFTIVTTDLNQSQEQVAAKASLFKLPDFLQAIGGM